MFWPSASSPEVGGSAVGDDVALGDLLAGLHHRTLVDVGVLVRARVLGQLVDVHADVAGHRLVVVDPDHDAVGVDVVHRAAPQGHHAGTRVHRRGALDAGADQRLLRAQAGHRLALHVGAHQRAVRVVVLEERNQRSRHRDDLRGGDVHVLNVLGRLQLELVLDPAGHQRVGELAVLVDRRVRLRDHVVAFLDRRQELDLVGDLAVLHLAVRRLEEAVLVGARVQRKRIDQADVRTLRRLDRADAPVVGRVHVAHLEAGALARQAARSQGRDAALVGDLRQRIGLVHELRQLAGTEEFLDRRRDGLGVDQVVRHQVLRLRLRQPLLDGALDAHQARAELVLRQLAHRAHAPVAEVVDVVDVAAAVAQLHQDPDHFDNVLGAEREARLDLRFQLLAVDALRLEVVVHLLDHRQSLGLAGRAFQADLVERELGRAFPVGAHVGLDLPGQRDVLEAHLPAGFVGGVDAPVELHAAHGRQVVALLGEEQAVEQRLDGVLGGRLARAHHAVDRNARRGPVGRFVGAQGLGDVGALVEVVGEQGLDLADLRLAQLGEKFLGDFIVRVGDDLPGVSGDDVVRERAAEDEFVRRGNALDARRLHVADVLDRDALVLGDDGLARLVGDVEARDFPAQALGHDLEQHVRRLDVEGVEREELLQDALGRVAQRLQQDGHRHLAAAVDAEEHDVLRVELEVQPRAAVRDDARREKQLPGAVRLAAVVLEEHARRAVQLGHDYALGPVDDERTRRGHERDLAHVHLLLLHFLGNRLGRILVEDHQAHLGAQGARVGQAALLALLDVERRLAELEAHELEARRAGVRGNRENRGERRLQPFVAARFRGDMRLQERRVGLELRRNQIRHGLHVRALGEALADAFTLGQRIGHDGS